MRKFNPFANLSLKIIALLFATLFWVYIVNIGDPIEEELFRDIPVIILNDEIITAQGLAYQLMDDTDRVTVTVRARISLLRQIMVRDIVVTADITDIDFSTNLIPIEVSVKGVEGLESVIAIPGNVRIKIEELAVNTFPVSVEWSGNPREGFVVGEREVSHPTLTIEGPESLIERISRVVAQIGVNEMSMSADLPATIRIYDYYDMPISLTSLRIHELTEEELTVHVQMLSTRNIALQPNLEEMLEVIPEGYQLSVLSFEPPTVLVSGVPEVLMALPGIIVPTATFAAAGDITGIVSEPIDIRPYLPEGIRLVDESVYRIIVTMVVEQIDRRGIEIPVRAIPTRHLSENLQIDFPGEQSVILVFMGEREALDVLEIGGKVYLDLSEFTNPGRVILPVRMEALNVEGVSIFGALPTIEIELTEREMIEETED